MIPSEVPWSHLDPNISKYDPKITVRIMEPEEGLGWFWHAEYFGDGTGNRIVYATPEGWADCRKDIIKQIEKYMDEWLEDFDV